MATVTPKQIQAFVTANIDNPQAIASAAAQYGVSSTDIAQAMNVDVGVVSSYFNNASVEAPPVTIAPTPAPTPTPVPTPTPTPAPTPTPTPTNQFVASTAPGSVGTSYGQASGDLIAQVQQQNPELSTALQNGTASVNYDANTGTYNLINTTTGAPIGGNYQVQVGINGVGINIPTASGAVLQASVTPDQSGAIAPVTASQVYNTGLNAGAGGFAGGGQLMQQAVAIGLAYALPIAGQSIAASLSTAAFAVPTYVGTALASISLGVAQGQTLEQAITNAAPSLLSAGIMDQTGLSKLSADITNNPQYQNAINNMAGSIIATSAKGGNIQDVVANAAAAGGGTLIGNTLQADGVSTANAQAIGQALATNMVTGSTLSGLISGAGSLGGSQAKANAATKTNVATIDAPVIDLSQGTNVAGISSVPGELPSGGFQPGQITQTANGLFTTFIAADGTTVNIPVTYNQQTGSVSTTSTNPEAVNYVKTLTISDPSKINPIFFDKTPIDPGLSAEEQAALQNVASKTSSDMINALKAGKSVDEYYNTYAYTSSLPTFVTQMATELANDPTGTDPSYNSLRAEYKAVTGTDFISPSGVPNYILPPVTIVASRVISSDPVSGITFVVGADGNPLPISSTVPLTPGETVAYNTTTNAAIPSSVTNQTPQDVINTSPETPAAPAEKPTTYPSATNLTGPANIPSTGAVTGPNAQTAIAPVGTYAPDTPPASSSPRSPAAPAGPATPKVPAGPVYPTATTTSPISPSAVTTLLGTSPTSQTLSTPSAPTGPSTEKTPYPTFKPDVFVESNVPKTLANISKIGGSLPTTGETVGIGGGGGGVSVESGQQQQPVWNVASLKLKEEAEGTPDYGALSSALGI